MTPITDLTRRTMLAASAVLPWATAHAEPGSGPSLPAGSNILVAYFSRAGHTRVIAGAIRRELKAGLFEIRPARPYPEDYERAVAQAAEGTTSLYEPPLADVAGRRGVPRAAVLGNDAAARDPFLPARA